MKKTSFRRVLLDLETLEQRDVPSVTAGAGISLGTASGYAALGLTNSHIVSLDSPVTGDVGVSKGGDFFNLGSTVSAGIVESAKGQVLSFGKAQPSVTINAAALSQADADALSASSQAAALQATQTFKNIDAPTTVKGDGGVNVIDITGDIRNSLILNGTSSDVFIVNVTGSVDLSGRETLGLAGGVTAGHVLYNFIGANGSVVARNGTVIDGTLLGPKYGFDLEGQINGEIIAGRELLLMGAKVTEGAFAAPVAPTVGSLAGSVTAISGISGINVNLEDSSGNILQSTATDANGNFSFTNLQPGTYQLAVVPTKVWLANSAQPGTVNGATDGSSASDVMIGSIVLSSGGAGTGYNFNLMAKSGG